MFPTVHRALEKKHGEVQGRADRAQKQQDVLAGTLDDIKAEVDKYLLWLTEKEQQMAEEAPLGYNVKDAETRLQEHNVRGEVRFRNMWSGLSVSFCQLMRDALGTSLRMRKQGYRNIA